MVDSVVPLSNPLASIAAHSSVIYKRILHFINSVVSKMFSVLALGCEGQSDNRSENCTRH